MQLNEDKVLKKIHRNQLHKYDIDLETYQIKKKQGLTPFLNHKNEVEWLSRDEYSVLEIKKKKHYKGKEHKKSGSTIEFAQKLAFITILLGILLVVYYLLKIIGLF